MTTMNMKPSPLIAAVLAVAAFYYFSQKKVFGKTVFATEGNTPPRNAGTNFYQVAPGQRSQPQVQASIVQSGLGVVQSLLNLAQSPLRTGNTFNPPAPITYTQDLRRLPSYLPDVAGEDAARSYFLNNPDEFISNPPPSFVYNDGQVGGGGWLDQQ